MKREQFEIRHSPDWRELEELLGTLETRPRRREPVRQARLHRIPELYRKVCAHLSLVRGRHYGVDLERRLNALALRGHDALYRDRNATFREVVDFAVGGFPRAVRAEAGLLLLCLGLFYLPAIGMASGTIAFPDLVYTVLDADQVAGFEQMYGQDSKFGRSSDDDFLMFGFYIKNNVGIAFRTFASGIFLGLGSIFFLVYNGLVLGAVAGHIVNAGLAPRFFSFVIGHGAFELTAIVISGMAGVRLGLAILAPGRLGRGAALESAGRSSLRLVWGVAGLLVVAAFVEAFWSSSEFLSVGMKFLAGGIFWSIVALYLGLFGRNRAT